MLIVNKTSSCVLTDKCSNKCLAWKQNMIKNRPTSLRSLTTKYCTILYFLLALTFEKLLFLLIKMIYTHTNPLLSIHLPERKIQVY